MPLFDLEAHGDRLPGFARGSRCGPQTVQPLRETVVVEAVELQRLFAAVVGVSEATYPQQPLHFFACVCFDRLTQRLPRLTPAVTRTTTNVVLGASESL